MKIGCIIQARNTSSRLPKKVMLPLPIDTDMPVLGHVINRVKRVEMIDTIIVATTTNVDDDSIIEYTKQSNVASFRGSEHNVLSRFYLAATEHNLDVVIRITSDCPCLDSDILLELIQFHLNGNYDYSSNAFKRNLPHGMDAEIFSYKALQEAYNGASEKYEIEHVTPYIYKTNIDKYNIGVFEKVFKNDLTSIRITLDTKEDYMLLCSVFDYFKDESYFGLDEICDLFEKKPWLYYINKMVMQKNISLTLDEQLEAAKKILKQQELYKVIDFINGEKND